MNAWTQVYVTPVIMSRLRVYAKTQMAPTSVPALKGIFWILMTENLVMVSVNPPTVMTRVPL